MAHILDHIAEEYEKLQQKHRIREAAKGLDRAKTLHSTQKAAIQQMFGKCKNGFNELHDYYYRIEQACLQIFSMKDAPDGLLRDTQIEYRLARGMRMFLNNLKKP